MKVFNDDHHLGDLWCLKISESLQRVESILRVGEGKSVKNFETISNPLCDLIVELELLALLTDTEAPLLEPLEPRLNFSKVKSRVEKQLNKADENLAASNKRSAKPKNEDREGLMKLIDLCESNLTAIENPKA